MPMSRGAGLLLLAVLLALPVPLSRAAEKPAASSDEPKVNYTYYGVVNRVIDGGTVSLDVDLGFGVWMSKTRISRPLDQLSGQMARLAASDTVGVVLPAVNFNLGSADYADARALVDAGAAVALATDINPGSAPCPSMPLVMAIACRYGRLLPSEALVAATVNAAHATGVAGRVGSIEVGKQADILVVDAPDYRYLAYEFGGNLVSRVIKAGNIVR